jgi:AraC-like DNA-binding protein
MSLQPPLEFNQTPKKVPMPPWGVVVFEAHHAPGFYGEMNDPFSKFLLLLAGQGEWEFDSRQFVVSQDTLCHVAANVPHRQRDVPGNPVTLYVVHYEPNLLPAEVNQSLTEARMFPIYLQGTGLDQAKRVRSLVQEMLYEQQTQRTGYQTMIKAHLLELAVLTLRWQRNDEFRIDRFSDSAARVAHYAARLKTEFFHASSLDAAAQAVGLGRRRFTELFRELTGESWRRYVNRLRMDYATKLLVSTERSVTAIAFECGFEELSHFHHSFKDSFGVSPLTYRHQSRSPGTLPTEN